MPCAIEEDAVCVRAKSGLRCTLLPKVYATFGTGNKIWEKYSC